MPQPVKRHIDAVACDVRSLQNALLKRLPARLRELRGNDLRLLIDGEEVLAAEGVRPDRTAGAAPQVGVWSQGVRVSIRRVAVYDL